jgi:hypothetical protein
LSFLPLSLLSFTSVLGILCCLASKFPRVYSNSYSSVLTYR